MRFVLVVLVVMSSLSLSCRERKANASGANAVTSSQDPCVEAVKNAATDHQRRLQGSDWNAGSWQVDDSANLVYAYTKFGDKLHLYEINGDYMGGFGTDLVYVDAGNDCKVLHVKSVYAE